MGNIVWKGINIYMYKKSLCCTIKINIIFINQLYSNIKEKLKKKIGESECEEMWWQKRKHMYVREPRRENRGEGREGEREKERFKRY